jgi:hypothetical protein
MERVAVLVATVVVMFAAQQTAPKAKPKASDHTSPKRDPEDRWICRMGSYHDCHCQAMMAEAQERGIKQCRDASSNDEEYARCVSKLPSNCAVIQGPDEQHPEHSCKRNCKAIAGCQCEDGPVCKGPIVYQPPQGDEDQ